jgi:16S rRNA (guanine1207-N2)-methyltransferase
MSHYYKFDPQLKTQPNTITYRYVNDTYSFKSDLGVFSKQRVDFGTHLMLMHVDHHPVTHILDMGCGYGVVGIVMKYKFPSAKLSAFDINPRAVELTRANIEIHQVKNANVFISDGIPFDVSDVDLALLNPPIRAGKQVVFQLYEQAHKVLKSKGALYIVIQKKQGAESSQKFLESLFHTVKRVAKEKGYFVFQAIKD